jgi:polysaccharide biosynthesis/export protein
MLRRKLCFLCNTVSVSRTDTLGGNSQGCERDVARVIHPLREGRGQIMRSRGFFAIPIVLLALSCASGCAYMPTSGPAVQDVVEGTNKPVSVAYELVRLTPQVVQILSVKAPSFASAFSDRRVPAEIRFGVGDVVAVTIFEAAAGGLFIPSEAGVRPGNFITLPNQAVDHDGNISVPYTSGIRALGRTPPEVQQAIVDALKSRAIEPQVVVSLVDQRTSLISVLGEVRAPSRFPASAAGEHLLDTITRAGGPSGQGFDTWVMLERGHRREIVPFGALVYNPSNNIFTHPNDTIYVYREPQTFVAFGATGKQGQYTFDAWRISLAEAVGKASGLDDTKAEPGAVFLYRGEPREVARLLGIDVSKYNSPIIPVIYNVNFRDPSGYFLAVQMQVRNKDVLYVSNATTVEATKFMNYVRLIVGTVNDPIVAATNVYILKGLAQGTSSASIVSGGSTGVAAPTP